MTRPLLPGEGERFTVEAHESRAAWLEARQPGIGGSDAVSLWADPIAELGGKTFGSPWSVYAKKRGLIPPGGDEIEPDWIRIGRRMEHVIADEFEEREGAPLYYPGEYTILRSIAHPWLAVSLDRVILHPLDPGVFEAKNRSVGARNDWREALPLAVQVQIAHGLLVTGWTFGAGAAIVGGNQFYAHRYERDETFIEAHFRRCEEMWTRIDEGKPPPTDSHAATTEALSLVYARSNGTELVVSGERAEWLELNVVDRLLDAREEAKRQEAREEDAENQIRAILGDYEHVKLPSGRVLKSKTEPRKARVCECGKQIAAASAPRPIRILKGSK